MKYNDLAQDFNSTYRIGFYKVPDEIKNEIKILMGEMFYSYYEESELVNDSLLDSPDLIIVGKKGSNLLEIDDHYLFTALDIWPDSLNNIWNNNQISYEKIENAAIQGNIMKMRCLIAACGNNIDKILDLVEKKDPHTSEHLNNVSRYAEMLGNEMGLDEGTIYRLVIGGKLYDIGKLCFPDSVLFNTSYPMPKEKIGIMERHVAMSLELIPEEYLFLIKNMVLEHHERLDGSGYPKKICGDEISLEAQILAVLDTYDALTTKCSYQDIHDFDEAFAILYKLSDGDNPKLNRQIIDSLKNMIKREYAYRP